MLQAFGFLVDLIPAVVKEIVEEAFEQAVMPDDLQGSFLAGRSQPRAVMFLIFDERRLGSSKFLHHFCYGSGADAEALGERVARYFTVFRAAQLKNGFEVVVNRFGAARCSCFRHSKVLVYLD